MQAHTAREGQHSPSGAAVVGTGVAPKGSSVLLDHIPCEVAAEKGRGGRHAPEGCRTLAWGPTLWPACITELTLTLWGGGAVHQGGDSLPSFCPWDHSWEKLRRCWAASPTS